MRLESIDHLVITTRDLKACLHFYVDILGMEHEIFGEGRHLLRFGREKINIHTRVGQFALAGKHADYGCQDFCLIAEGDIHEIYAELREKGAPLATGITPQEGARGKMDSVYLYDPDGSLVEIAVYR